GNPSKEQREELKGLAKANEIVLALDNDETGRRYQNELLKELALINPYIEGLGLPDEIKDVNELLQKKGVNGIKEAIVNSRRLTPFGNVKERVPEILEKFRIAKENAFPIPETLSYLEEFLKDGLLPGLYGVAGIPGIGKTTWLNLVCDEMAKIGCKSIYFLTEEPEYRLLLRTIKRENLKRFEELIQQDWIENRITFELTPEYTAESLKDIVSGIMSREGKTIFVVDSLHALQLGNNNPDTREKTILKTELLAHIARDLMIPVFFTSFIPKSLYKEKPNIGVFKEAGEIEYLIDVGIVLWKDIDTGNKDEKIPVSLHIVKNRYGKTGEVELLFNVERCDIEKVREGELK
ncbi:MAG TPA: DnaB-like helicase C-terminal domain-containing protein, partial [bacterium]|nr:DnaB-like helicase C-terminal domain-containing protein [bacterium]